MLLKKTFYVLYVKQYWQMQWSAKNVKNYFTKLVLVSFVEKLVNVQCYVKIQDSFQYREDQNQEGVPSLGLHNLLLNCAEKIVSCGVFHYNSKMIGNERGCCNESWLYLNHIVLILIKLG